jgi:NitT/TauT family transport system ATP-binding protein
MVETMSHEHTFADSVLEVRNVTAFRGETLVLRDLDLTVRDVVRPGFTQGQVVGLVGPSGIGKSTLFRILAGLDQPARGEVRVRTGATLGPVCRGQVGVVAQHYPLFPHRTVLNNLTVAGRQAGLRSGEGLNKATDLLSKFGLLDQLAKYPCQLSGGQRQRAAIAQQFMCSDHYLLMDEPFSGLDLLAKHQAIELIDQMAAADELATFIVVTHDIESAIAVSDTLWLLGRERDAEGKPIPGARVMHTYDLAERGLAWEERPKDHPQFFELLREIETLFPTL